MTRLNAQWRLAARPVGLPKPSDWEYVEEPAPEPADGQFLVRLEYLSLDPAMRGWMNEGRSYVPPVGLGEVMRAGGIGRVVDSRHGDYAVGDHVFGVFGVQRFALSDGTGVIRVDTTRAPGPVHLGVLGVTGLTAYFGLLDIGRPEPGQTVVVSGAAGAVGSVAGQIARIKGCRAVGIAGGPEKCEWLTEELGFDAAIDYKRGDLRGQLREHTPDGVDVYFDNVGGEILDEVLRRLARGARVVICGAISQYNAERPPAGPANYIAAARDARVDDRVPRVRLRPALPGGGRTARPVAAQRRAPLTRGRGHWRPRPVSGGVPDAVPRREHRQARPTTGRGRAMSLPLGYELRFWPEFGRLLTDARFWTPAHPPKRGDRRRPVLLIPGFLAGDASLAVLAGWLRRRGHEVRTSGIRLNVGCAGRDLDRLGVALEAIGEPAVVVGQSRGGTLARALAARDPDRVAALMTLGSPCSTSSRCRPR